MKFKNVYIVDGVRSPIGSFCGSLGSQSAVELGLPLVSALLKRNQLATTGINEVIMGNVLTANNGQAPARQVALKGGLDQGVSAYTINKVCSSGLFSNILGARSIELGVSQVVIAGGIESMSQAPFYLTNYRQGVKLGDQKLVDSVIKDGLWDVYNDFHMGCAGELCAKKYNFSREMQDEFAIESYDRALASMQNKEFENEIVPIEIRLGKKQILVSEDEEPSKLVREKVSQLRPAFDKDGTITAVNASSLNDGSAMLLLASEEAVKKYNLKPRAKIISEGMHSQAPEWFTTAPVTAVNNCIANSGLKKSDFDFFEINEAFSAVALACMKELGLSKDVVNVRGGAVALGHPIGASGARILVTLLNILESKKAKRGIVGICNGGGEATAIAIELIS